MRIVADHKIPFLEGTFGLFGEIRKLSSTELTASAVRDADALLVRSETRVDSDLLRSSRVRFVGSPTIGVDHVDLQFLEQAGIPFFNAPGCNARSVVEYVLTALCYLAENRGLCAERGSLGIVGVGNIGSILAREAKRLGLRVLLNDPPRQRREGGDQFSSLEEVCGCDFLTLHVPLNKVGPDSTHHLFDRDRISSLQPGAILLNTSRGAVVDNLALEKALQAGEIAGAVLDVWENEPEPRADLVRQVDIATPHIAGYSTDGKLRGTWMIFEEFCRLFDFDLASIPLPRLPSPNPPTITFGSLPVDSEARPQRRISLALQEAYPVLRDDAQLRHMLAIEPDQRGHYFRSLRANYPVRREFSAFRLGPAYPPRVRRLLTALGFRGEG